jgi:hypothetical protein
MFQISARGGGRVPQALIHALIFAKHVPVWIELTIDA